MYQLRINQQIMLLKKANLEAEFLEVESVAHIVVSGHGLRVVVHHDGLETQFSEFLSTADCAPIKLYAGPNPVNPAPKHHVGTTCGDSRMRTFELIINKKLINLIILILLKSFNFLIFNYF